MTPAELHRTARPAVLSGLAAQGLGSDPLGVVRVVQGVGWLETRYGSAWRGAGSGSNNWGAIQAGRPPCDPARSFEYRDTHPNPDGTSTSYAICFRRYGTPQDGAAGLAREVVVRRPQTLAAARTNDIYGASAALLAERYYEGVGRTIADRIWNHYKALHGAVAGACLALGEPVPTMIPKPGAEPWQDAYLPDNPMILRGSFGPYVKVWQGVLDGYLEPMGLDIAVDGAFGPITRQHTVAWQRSYGLKADGVVGPRTWGKAAEIAA